MIETHCLTIAIVLLTEAFLSMLIRGICKKLCNKKHFKKTGRYVLTRGSNGFIGSEYFEEVR